MDHTAKDTELIIRHLNELRLPTVKDGLDDIAADAAAGGWDYHLFLLALLQREIGQRIGSVDIVRG